MPKRKPDRGDRRGKIDQSQQEVEAEEEMDVTQASNGEEDPQENEGEQMQRSKIRLVKQVAQCILASCTKRGHCKDMDIAGLFEGNERNMKEEVIRKVIKQLKNIFGVKVERDEEGKRYYVYNCLNSNIGMKMAEKIKGHSPFNGQEGGDWEGTVRRPTDADLENPQVRRWILTSTLMFIFMSKRHTEVNTIEKGIDGILLKNFLKNMFEKFGMVPLKEEQYGNLVGPSKSADFIAQGWLRREVRLDQASGIEEVFYFWGARAEKVVNKQEMLEEFCKIYGGTIRDWPNHAKAAGVRGN